MDMVPISIFMVHNELGWHLLGMFRDPKLNVDFPKYLQLSFEDKGRAYYFANVLSRELALTEKVEVR